MRLELLYILYNSPLVKHPNEQKSKNVQGRPKNN